MSRAVSCWLAPMRPGLGSMQARVRARVLALLSFLLFPLPCALLLLDPSGCAWSCGCFSASAASLFACCCDSLLLPASPPPPPPPPASGGCSGQLLYAPDPVDWEPCGGADDRQGRGRVGFDSPAAEGRRRAARRARRQRQFRDDALRGDVARRACQPMHRCAHRRRCSTTAARSHSERHDVEVAVTT